MMKGMTLDHENKNSHTDLCLYLDFYGQLMTDHCREILELYYGEDMSLSEIAENLGITRQAVHDRIRQGTGQLIELEKKLGLSARFQITREHVRVALEALDQGQTDLARDRLRQLESEL
jgi:predicted DNA-binding protein YlxM (UPF0122 family)